MLKAGQVIWGPDPYRQKAGRPMIVVVDEDDSGSLIVCTTTSRSVFIDETTRLPAGCHPNLPHECTVDYESAQVILDCSVLHTAIREGLLRTDRRISLEVEIVVRIQQGFAISQLVSPRVLEYARRRRIL